jgi:hypothetical protein
MCPLTRKSRVYDNTFDLCVPCIDLGQLRLASTYVDIAVFVAATFRQISALQSLCGHFVKCFVEFSIDLIQIVRFISRRVDVAIGIESVLVDHISPPHACLLWWACTWMHVSMYVVTIKMAVSSGCTGNISSARGKHCCDHYGTQL